MAEELGAKLGSASCDAKKILLHLLPRVVCALYLGLTSIDGRDRVLDTIFLAGLLIFTFFPLVHLGDRADFYEYGIIFKKKRYTFGELGEISFRNFRYLFERNMMDTDAGSKNITYIKDFRKTYNRAYMEHVIEL